MRRCGGERAYPKIMNLHRGDSRKEIWERECKKDEGKEGAQAACVRGFWLEEDAWRL